MRQRQSSEPVAEWTGLLSRRDLLRVGCVGIAGSLVPTVLRAAPERKASACSVILVWLAGGVTHIDSFDPKPDAPEEIRGMVNQVEALYRPAAANPAGGSG